MINQAVNRHLTREEIIKKGSFYTGKELVDLVYEQVSKYISNEAVIADFGAGYGAFIEKFKDCSKRCFGTEIDNLSYQLLKEEFKSLDFYYENSLINVSREKYGLKENDILIIVGNPPYNDTTSIFKKGEKGEIICDYDIMSRDLGISFLKAFDKLKADYICVLHPLAYLIKKQNFNSLGSFKNNYRLINATIFSSKEFESIKKSYSDFPVVSALYKREKTGMTYQDINQFTFNIYKSDSVFVLEKIFTIDGLVDKYPKTKKTDSSNNINLFGTILPSEDLINGLQFYTLRDMNALLRNAGFVDGPIPNGLDVSMNNLYQYSWLYFLKMNFKPEKNKFLYGNLSPLYTKRITDREFQQAAVSYAFNNNEIVKKYLNEEKIKAVYGAVTDQYNALYDELNKLSNLFN